MTLEEYMKARNRLNLTPNEYKAFGINNKVKGWKKSVKGVDFPPEVIIRALKYAISASSSKPSSKRSAEKMLTAILKSGDVSGGSPDEQKVYLIKSQIGLYKIGISKNPEQRKNNLSTAAGVRMAVLACWKVGQHRVTDGEASLHQYFKSNRRVGEWFYFEESPHEKMHKFLENRYGGVNMCYNNLEMDKSFTLDSFVRDMKENQGKLVVY